MTRQPILITGATGRIGCVLADGLSSDFTLTPVAKEYGHDLREAAGLTELFAGHGAVIHLAWQYAVDVSDHVQVNDENMAIAECVLAACHDSGIKRVVVASSVHADFFYDFQAGDKLKSANAEPRANEPYGQSKVAVEAMCRSFAARNGLDITAVRFGRVDAIHLPAHDDVWEQRVFLSPADCVSLARSILDAPIVSGRFVVMYAVSNNTERLHDVSNPFGWMPTDSIENHYLRERFR